MLILRPKNEDEHKNKDNLKMKFYTTMKMTLKITRPTIGAHEYNSLLNELSITILWYNMLSNIRFVVLFQLSYAIVCYLMLACVIVCYLM